MKHPSEIQRLLEKRFASQHQGWLLAGPASDSWPLSISLGVPSEPAALKQVEAVRAWCAAWQAWQGPGELQWTERRWRVLGTQRLPESLLLPSPSEASAWVGQHERWARARERHQMLSLRWPPLAQHLARRFDVLADYSDADLGRMMAVLAWLEDNPDSGLYLRQLPIVGVDTKWLESRQEMLRELLAGLRFTPEAAGLDFYELSGVKEPPVRIRMRILDPGLRASLRGLGDITAPVHEVAALALPISRVVIVENLQTGLALPDMPGTVAFMALGKSVDLLAPIEWLRNIEATYWGDIDTHGFAILNRARSYLPRLRSILMDEATLVKHADLWGTEPMPAKASDLPMLTDSELAVYRALRGNVWGHQLRLEQERISWEWAMSALLHT